jgi:predicted MFS family arabinose efflux permease
VFAIGVFTAPYLTAQRLLIPETFGDDETLVVQGNALLEGVIRLATLLGPAVAGVAISAIGAVNILYVDGATYLVAYLILVSGLPKPAASLADAAAGEGRGVFAGARFVLANPLLRRVTAAALLFGFFFPPLLASLPVLTEQRYAGDPRVVGLLYAAWGAGAVIGTFGVMRYATRMPPMRMGALGAAGVAIPLWLLVFPLPVWQFALVLLVSGLFTPMLNAPVITLIMLRTPAEMRAKVVTFVMTANLLAGPVAFSLTGPVLDEFGLAPVFLVVAIGVSSAAVVLMTMAGIRDEPAQDPAEASA